MRALKLFFWGIAALLSVSLLPAQAKLFNEAQLAYDRGLQTNGLATAKALYTSEINAGSVSGEVFYNLGNTLYRLEQPGAAILNYRRARHFLPRDADVKANEAFVRQQTGALPAPQSAVGRLLDEFNLFEWLLIGLVAFWTAALLLLLILALRNPSEILRNILYASLTLLVISIAGTSHWLLERARPEFVITDNAVQALFAPLQDSTPHFALPPGSILSVEERADGWVRVRQNKRTGWVQDTQGQAVWPWTHSSKTN